MKKSILFVINNLNCGGAEKALISLLETIDYSKFNVDLFLFKHEGIFFSQIPNEVTLLDEPKFYMYYDMPIKKAILGSLKEGKWITSIARLKAGIIFKTERNGARSEQRVWKYLAKSLATLDKEYDVAIGFLEKNPIYFCVDKVNAKKKIGFIHNDYEKLGMDSSIDNLYFSKLNTIATVSDTCAEVLIRKFPMFRDRVTVIRNIVSPKLIKKLAENKLEVSFDKLRANLVSVGRLNKQKGFDLAIKALKILVDRGLNVHWTIVGEGEERNSLEALILKLNLQSHISLIGNKENPYPYVRQSDIYIQPSRFEGKSIAIDEAKILAKPIVVTNFSTVNDQIKNNQNGIVVEMDPVSLANGIERVLKNKGLALTLEENLKLQEMGTEEEIYKLYLLF